MNKLLLDDLLKRAMIEDIGTGDVTSETIFSQDHMSKGYLLAKQDMIAAGIEVFSRVFAMIDDKVTITFQCADGEPVQNGQKFAVLQGPTRSLLTGERVALNFLQHLSGIATETRKYVEACAGYGTVIVDTRKTTPGLRMLEKYAVAIGGGKNHRYGLDTMVLIKDNHIKAAGGILQAVTKVRSVISPYLKIEVEAETLEEVQTALSAKVDIIMLDNMPLSMIREATILINHQALVEVSGNVTLDRIEELASAGVNIISSGALTHSVKATDISMRLEGI
ncbi:MAG: nadC [Firmicutes bacterium]|nr:nadC [Bacillota bacterium]